MYKWFLASRYLRTKVIAYFGIVSVMLCVAMVLVVMSVMGGFLDTVRARSRGLLSDIILDNGTAQGFPYYEEFSDRLKNKLPDVVQTITPVVHTAGIMRVPATTWTKLTRIMGIRLHEFAQVSDFGKGLHYEKYYPGTTHLGSQLMPVAGLKPDGGEFKLPAELQSANAKWRANEKDASEIKAYDAAPFVAAVEPEVISPLPGDRVFMARVGEPEMIGPEEFGIIVGCDVLYLRRQDGGFDRDLARGIDLSLSFVPLSPTGNPLGEAPIKMPLRYADDSRTGIYEIDSTNVYVDFDMLQQKLAMDPQPLVDGGVTKARVNQLLIQLKPGTDVDAGRTLIKKQWGEFYESLGFDIRPSDFKALNFVGVFTWEDMQRQYIAAIEKEKVLVTILFGVISLVAILLVGCIFYMIVEKKTKDIGILKSLGASSDGVGSMFIAYAAAVGIVGAILGIAAGTVFVWYINEFQDWLASMNPKLRVWSADVYSFDSIPNVVKTADALWIGVVAVFASMLGSIIPAAIAARVWPVRALRYE